MVVVLVVGCWWWGGGGGGVGNDLNILPPEVKGLFSVN